MEMNQLIDFIWYVVLKPYLLYYIFILSLILIMLFIKEYVYVILAFSENLDAALVKSGINPKMLVILGLTILVLEVTVLILFPFQNFVILSEYGNLPFTSSIENPDIHVDETIYDLFKNKAVYKNDLVIFNISIINKNNNSIQLEHNFSLTEPDIFQYPNKSFTLDKFERINFEDNIYIKSEGLNIVNLSYKTNNQSVLYDRIYINVLDPQTETARFIHKYSLILSIILIFPTAIIALKNLKDLLMIKKTNDEN